MRDDWEGRRDIPNQTTISQTLVIILNIFCQSILEPWIASSQPT